MATLLTIAGFTAKTAGTLATVASVGSTALGVAGAVAEGRQNKANLQYQSKIQEQQADSSRASGQRAAASRYREGKLIASRQNAIAAASGGGADDSVIDMMGDTASEVDLGARTEMFNAEQQARGYESQSDVSLTNASQAGRNGTLSALGAGFSGLSAMDARFGKKKQTAPKAGRYG